MVSLGEFKSGQRQYYAKPGSHLSDKDAQIIGPEIERLQIGGLAKAEDIVEAARSEQSPLHPYFEWDDTVAADRYRQERARYLSRSIEVVIVKGETEPQRVRGFFAVTQRETAESPAERGYVSIDVLIGEPDKAAQIIGEAHSHLIGWATRYRQYRALFPGFEQRFSQVFEAIDALEDDDRSS